MRLSDLLSLEQICIQPHAASQTKPSSLSKEEALRLLAHLLANPAQLAEESVLQVLIEREAIQSTGIGEGVAIPHGALDQLQHPCAALLIVPDGVEFQALDGLKVHLLFALIGPKRATGEHLKMLARISRLLRDRSFRSRLASIEDKRAALQLIAEQEGEQR